MAVITLETVNIQNFDKNSGFSRNVHLTAPTFEGSSLLIWNCFGFCVAPSSFQDEPFIRFYSIVWHWAEKVTENVKCLSKQMKTFFL